MFTLAAATGWTLDHIWEELDYRMAIRFYNWLPNKYYRDNAMTARLAYSFESFAGAKHPDFGEWLPAWMRPDTLNNTGPAGRPEFSPAVAAAVDLAFDLGYLSQAALVALGPKRLRAAGAFRPDRDTTITNQHQ